MRSTTNAPIARQKPELQMTPVFRSPAAEITQLRFALDHKPSIFASRCPKTTASARSSARRRLPRAWR